MKRLIKKSRFEVTAQTYPTANDVPYNYKKYVLSHDGNVDVDHLINSLSVFDGITGNANWDSGSRWDTDYQYRYSKNFCLDQVAEELNIHTTVLVQLKEVEGDLIEDTNTEIYRYEPTGKVKVKVKAGSKSAFDNSNKLYMTQEFDGFDINGINKFIESANNTIANNVNPEADHNNSSKEFNEAYQNYTNSSDY